MASEEAVTDINIELARNAVTGTVTGDEKRTPAGFDKPKSLECSVKGGPAVAANVTRTFWASRVSLLHMWGLLRGSFGIVVEARRTLSFGAPPGAYG